MALGAPLTIHIGERSGLIPVLGKMVSVFEAIPYARWNKFLLSLDKKIFFLG